jgi:hypothetical protein
VCVRVCENNNKKIENNNIYIYIVNKINPLSLFLQQQNNFRKI